MPISQMMKWKLGEVKGRTLREWHAGVDLGSYYFPGGAYS